RDQNQNNEARYGVSGKGQADRREEGDRYGEEIGEENGEKGGGREKARCEREGGRSVGGRVHPSRSRRATLLAGQVRAVNLLVRRPARGEGPDHELGRHPQ